MRNINIKNSVLTKNISFSFVMLLSTTAFADSDTLFPPNVPGNWYYEIGGAETIQSPYVDRTRIRVKSSVSWNAGFSCNGFDPDFSVSNIMNGAKRGWANFQKKFMTNVQGSVTALPGYLLQRYDPNLYEMISTGLIQADELFSAKVKSCEKMAHDLANSAPNSEWVKISGHEKWKTFFDGNSEEDPDETDIQDTVDEMATNGNEGLDWVCDVKAGGIDNDPIKISEVAIAGYNNQVGRDSCDKTEAHIVENYSNPPSATIGKINVPNQRANPSFVRYWKTPKKAQEWLVDVTGETEIQTCNTDACVPRKSKPGVGLLSKAEETSQDIFYKMKDMIESENIKLSDLREISSDGVLISKDVIEALKSDPDASMLAIKLSQDISLQKQLLKALQMRRLLYSGKMSPVVSQNAIATEETNKLISQLDTEIKFTREEIEIGKLLSTNTVTTILNRATIRGLEGSPRISNRQTTTAPFID